jgi:transglutaminase-like putative cysteine protease
MKLEKISLSSGDKGIKEILLKMKDIIIKSDVEDKDRIIKRYSKMIVSSIPVKDEIGQINAILQWVRKHIKYVPDIYQVEEITPPHILLSMYDKGNLGFSSDCDDMALLTASLLRAIGFKVRLEAVAIKHKNRYDHARLSVYSQTLKRWLTLEPTSKTLPIGQGFKSYRNILAVEL